MKNWHQKHKESLTFGQRIADMVAEGMGSWTFVIAQTLFVLLWIIYNVTVLWKLSHGVQFDPYPFILLNLLFSTQAAYASPLIMMSQNRHSERDRHQAEADYQTNLQAKKEIEALQKHLAQIEVEKLDKIINHLSKRNGGKRKI